MNEGVERRVADQDPADVMSAEVFSLLKVCGGLRSTDVQGGGSRNERRAGPLERRRGDRRRELLQQQG
jgi:hypothetical protein